MSDVARRAGVSQPTVSMVLNETPNSRVGEKTRRRVWEAAEELGYRVDATAQGLRLGRSQMLGFITDAVATTPFAGEMIKGAQQEAANHSNLLLVVNTEGDRATEEDAIEIMLQHRVNGIIYSSWYHHATDPPAVLHEVPCVLINCYATDRSLPAIMPDEHQGGYDATRVLLDHGHNTIAFINSVPQSAEATSYAQQNEEPPPGPIGRLGGYRTALEKSGIRYDPSLVEEDEPVQEGGYAAMARLLRRSNRPTAVFCYNDRVAMGAYSAIIEAGLRIPEDIAVVGFDNQEVIAAHLRPPLSTIALPHHEMGMEGARYLLADTVDATLSDEPRRLHCEYVARESL